MMSQECNTTRLPQKSIGRHHVNSDLNGKILIINQLHTDTQETCVEANGKPKLPFPAGRGTQLTVRGPNNN